MHLGVSGGRTSSFTSGIASQASAGLVRGFVCFEINKPGFASYYTATLTHERLCCHLLQAAVYVRIKIICKHRYHWPGVVIFSAQAASFHTN